MMDSLTMIETERLILRVPEPNAAASVAAYYLRNRAHLAASSPQRGDDFFSDAYWSQELAVALAELKQKKALRLYAFKAAESTGPVVGHLAFTNIIGGAFQACHVGFGLDHEVVGAGLMTEALQAALTYVFRELKLNRVMANYVPTNERSARLLRRAGFVPEGYARDYLFLDGAWRDHVLTSRLAPP
jgi:[ribosomal protein S5]-alanine N-acetyltransferase